MTTARYDRESSVPPFCIIPALLKVDVRSLTIVMDRLDRSIGTYMMALNDNLVAPDRDANVESQTLSALV